MRIGEWVATASLRIGSNTAGYDTIHQSRHDTNKIPLYKHWHAQIGGMTGLKEMRAWLQAADPNLPVTMKSYWVKQPPRSIVADINGAFAAGQAVALAINADIVGNGYGKKISPHLGGHLVPLASDIQVTADGANYIGEILTWGDKKRIVFCYDQLGQAIFGYLAADLAQFYAGGGRSGPRGSVVGIPV